jgi:hypothetical protein
MEENAILFGFVLLRSNSSTPANNVPCRTIGHWLVAAHSPIKLYTSDFRYLWKGTWIQLLYCHVYSVFIEHLQKVTTSKYSAVANSHILQFPTARIKFSQTSVFIDCRLVTASNAVNPSASEFTHLLAGNCLPTN